MLFLTLNILQLLNFEYITYYTLHNFLGKQKLRPDLIQAYDTYMIKGYPAVSHALKLNSLH